MEEDQQLNNMMQSLGKFKVYMLFWTLKSFINLRPDAVCYESFILVNRGKEITQKEEVVCFKTLQAKK